LEKGGGSGEGEGSVDGEVIRFGWAALGMGVAGDNEVRGYVCEENIVGTCVVSCGE
jgi:hypothetical protein